MKESALKNILVVIFLFSFCLFYGCAGFVWVTEKGGYIPKELLDADKAIAEARQAGKAKRCPEEFNNLKEMRDRAYKTYWSCRTNDAINMAKEIIAKAKEFCPTKAEPSPPPPAPKPVPRSMPSPPPKPAPKAMDKMTLNINFDFDKAIIKDTDKGILIGAIKFIRKYPGSRILLEGHTCNLGTERYNQDLSERRAKAVKRYLVKEGGISESRITTIGYGELKPVASNKTLQGRTLNRRVEIIIGSE